MKMNQSKAGNLLYTNGRIVQKGDFALMSCRGLDAYSPLKVLSRGYSISKIEDKVIKHVKDVARDDIMVTRVNDGVITSCVVSTKEE